MALRVSWTGTSAGGDLDGTRPLGAQGGKGLALNVKVDKSGLRASEAEWMSDEAAVSGGSPLCCQLPRCHHAWKGYRKGQRLHYVKS